MPESKNRKKNNLIIIFTLLIIGFFLTRLFKTPKTSDSSSKTNAPFKSAEEIKKSGKIKIGVFSDKHPFGYVDENGKYQGYDIVLANRLAKDLGVEIEYIATSPANRAEYLESGKVDVMLANFTVTKERAEKVDFCLPYMKINLGVVSPKKAVIKSLDDLKGKTLIVAKGTTADVYFSQNENLGFKLLKFDEYADSYRALTDKRGDAMSTDNTEVLAWSVVNPEFEVGIEKIGVVNTIAPSVAKGNSNLLNWINEDMIKLGQEKFFHKAYEETLSPFYGSNVNPDNIVIEPTKNTDLWTGITT